MFTVLQTIKKKRKKRNKMKIIYDNDKTVNFSKLKVLDVFSLGAENFIKLPAINVEKGYINAIKISTGGYRCVAEDMPVRKFETELHIVG